MAGLLRGNNTTGAPKLVPGGPSLVGTRPAKAISGPDLMGGPALSLAALRGRPVIVNVWASWCLPCRDEGPDIRRFTADHPGIVVLGVDNDGRKADGVAFAREAGWTHRSIADGPGGVTQSLGVATLPTTIYIDARSVERGRTTGPVTYDSLSSVARRLGS